MKRARTTLALAAFAVVGVAIFVDRTEATPPPDNVWLRAPLLHFDASGPTLGGFDHTSLTVFSDGLVSYVVRPPAPSPPFSNRYRAKAMLIPMGHVRQLMGELTEAGVFWIEDEPVGVVDIPMRTVTAFRAQGNQTIAHTYNYFAGFGEPYEAVEEVIEKFIDQHFPGF